MIAAMHNRLTDKETALRYRMGIINIQNAKSCLGAFGLGYEREFLRVFNATTSAARICNQYTFGEAMPCNKKYHWIIRGLYYTASLPCAVIGLGIRALGYIIGATLGLVSGFAGISAIYEFDVYCQALALRKTYNFAPQELSGLLTVTCATSVLLWSSSMNILMQVLLPILYILVELVFKSSCLLTIVTWICGVIWVETSNNHKPRHLA